MEFILDILKAFVQVLKLFLLLPWYFWGIIIIISFGSSALQVILDTKEYRKNKKKELFDNYVTKV